MNQVHEDIKEIIRAIKERTHPEDYVELCREVGRWCTEEAARQHERNLSQGVPER